MSTVVKSSFVHDNEGASGFELGFSEDVEVGSKYWFLDTLNFKTLLFLECTMHA